MAYNIEAVRLLTHVTLRQIRYWDHIGLVRPSVQTAKGRGSRRLYSFEDLVELRTVARLLTAGLSLQKIGKVVRHMRGSVARPLASMRFLTDGDSLFVSPEDGQGWEDALRGNQIVWLVPVDELWRETEVQVHRIGEPVPGRVKVGSREYGVSYEPDLEDGGWVVECTDLPGCVSQGENMTEARRMIRDAIDAMTSIETTVARKKHAK